MVIVAKEETAAKQEASGADAALNLIVNLAEVAVDGDIRVAAALGAAALVVKGIQKIPDVKERLSDAKNEKELRKALKEVRQKILENADSTMTITDLAKAQKKSKKTGIEPIDDKPGCFVLATYKKMDFDKDLTDYIGIFIGCADNVAEGLSLAISRDGNPDVYADVKYKQNVHAYIFYFEPDQLEESYENLIQAFAGEKSYN